MKRLMEYLRWRRETAHCNHGQLMGIYGDAINHCGGWRLRCLECGSYVRGPVSLARERTC